MGKHLPAYLAGTALAAAMSASSAYAQVAAAGDAVGVQAGLEEIVVTARKKSESLIEVPVAVSAVSPAELDRSGATNLAQIAQLVPQVQMFSGTTGATFSVRGLGSSFLDSGLEQTVSVNIDGVQVGRGRIINAAFFDIDQIEVLKGPQALFFGKNSPAGVVSITSKGPGRALEGYVRAGYEFVARERYVEAAVGGPITDTLGVRLAARGSKMDGYLINNAKAMPWFFNPAFTNPGAPNRRQPRTEDISGRLTAVWQPSSDFSMTLKVVAGHHKDDGPDGGVQLICSSGANPLVVAPGVFGPAGIPDPFSDCKANNQKGSGSIPVEIARTIDGFRGQTKPFTDQKTLVSSLTARYEGDDVDVTSVTGYYHLKADSTLLPTYDSLSLAAAYSGERNNTFTQELRISTRLDSPVNATIGGYFESVESSNGVNTILFFAGFDPVTGSSATTQKVSTNSNQAYSLFGQLRWSLMENLELAGGLRWTHERKRTENVNVFLGAAAAALGAFVPAGLVYRSQRSEDNVSPEVTLTWHPQAGLTVYGAYKTGYKSGGISNPTLLTAGFSPANLIFGSENAKGFEAGVKGFLFDRTVRFGLTAYRYRYSNLQVSSFDTQSLSFLIQNAASARVQGVEADIDWLVVPALTLKGSLGYNRARYLSYPNAPCGTIQSSVCTPTIRSRDLSGAPLTRAPDWSGNVGAVYDVSVGSGLRVGLSADMNFSSSYFTQENNDPLAKQSSFVRLNGGLRVYTDDDKWELALIGRNLTNRYVIAYTTDTVYGPNGVYAPMIYRPREVRLQGTLRF